MSNSIFNKSSQHISQVQRLLMFGEGLW